MTKLLSKAALRRNNFHWYVLRRFAEDGVAGTARRTVGRVLRIVIDPLVGSLRLSALRLRNRVRRGAPIEVTLAGRTVLLDCESDAARHLWHAAHIDGRALHSVMQHLKSGGSFIDVDAGDGMHVLAAAVHCRDHRGGVVYAFVDDPRLRDELRRSLALNDASEFVIMPDGAVESVDSLCAGNPAVRVDLIRFTSGVSQLDALRGAVQQMASKNAPHIIVECSVNDSAKHGYHPVEIFWLLEKYGYVVRLLAADGLLGPRPDRAYNGTVIASKPHSPALAAEAKGADSL
jgi:hypothetical protein